ncbi:MAG: hypothetical protein Q8K65_03485 [Alphaproteobacteria bacterium]|nr:hypothetical protein [Alphaproteobacteria bacterium]
MGEKAWTFPKANPAFCHLSEREVWAALDNHEDDNAIEAEVTRLVASFFSRYKAYIETNGLKNLPPHIMHVATRWPIERVAVKIMVRYIETEAWEDGHMTCH